MEINGRHAQNRKLKSSTMVSSEFKKSDKCSENRDFNNNIVQKNERTDNKCLDRLADNNSESSPRWRNIGVSKIMSMFVVVMFSFTCISGSPVFLGRPGFNLQAQMSMARNIRHLPCISRKTGDEGVCMFAIDCLKANGSHLGTCIDRFYFGSCCQIPDKTLVPQIISNNIEDNTIFGSTFLTPEKIDKPDSNEIPPLKPHVEKPVKTAKPISTTPVITISSKNPTQTTTASPKTTPSDKSSSTMSLEHKTHPTAEDSPTTTTAYQTLSTTTASTTLTQTTTRKPVFHMSTRKPITTPKTVSPILSTTDAPFKLSTFQSVSEDLVKVTENLSTLNVVLTTHKPITTASSHTTKKPPTLLHKPVVPFKKPNVTYTKPPTATSTSQKPQQTSSAKPIITQAKPQKPLHKPSQKPTTPKPLPFGTRLTTKAPVKPTTQFPAIIQESRINTTIIEKPSNATTPVKPILLVTTTKKPAIQYTTKKPVATKKPLVTKKPILTLNTTSYFSNTTIQKLTSTTEKPTKPTQVTEVKLTTTTSTKPPTTLESKPTMETKVETTTEKASTTTTRKPTQTSTIKPTLTTSKPTAATTKPPSTTTEKNTTSSPILNEVDTQLVPSLESAEPDESTTHPPGLVTWTNSIDAVTVPTILANTTTSTEDTWSPITPPDGWVLISTVPPQPDSTGTLLTSPTPKPETVVIADNTTKPEESVQNTTSSSTPSISEVVDNKTPIESTSAVVSDIINGSVVTTESSFVTPTGNISANYSTEADTSSSTESSTLSSTHKSTVSPIEAVTTPLPTIPSSINMTDYKDVCGRRLWPEPRIVGGAKSSFGKWPWQISLRQWRTSTYLHKCGAALLNENWAITAAHCVEHVPPSDLLVRLGEHDLAHEEEPYGFQERRVQIVASHPHFDPATFEYDLALLRFYEPVTFQPNILPVCVPESDENFVGKTAYVTGWGRLYDDGPLPSVLQEVSVPVINNTLCESMYRSAGFNEHIPNIFICAGWKKGGFDSCEGDSGGPMVLQRGDKRFLLAGVISWGIGCAEPNQPGVYTRISEFRDWINQILQF